MLAYVHNHDDLYSDLLQLHPVPEGYECTAKLNGTIYKVNARYYPDNVIFPGQAFADEHSMSKWVTLAARSDVWTMLSDAICVIWCMGSVFN